MLQRFGSRAQIVGFRVQCFRFVSRVLNKSGYKSARNDRDCLPTELFQSFVDNLAV